jgi:hypothetical protein
MTDPKWETYAIHVMRLPVPGGHLYHCQDLSGGSANLVFVPEPDKCKWHNEHTFKICQKCTAERRK